MQAIKKLRPFELRIIRIMNAGVWMDPRMVASTIGAPQDYTHKSLIGLAERQIIKRSKDLFCAGAGCR